MYKRNSYLSLFFVTSILTACQSTPTHTAQVENDKIDCGTSLGFNNLSFLNEDKLVEYKGIVKPAVAVWLEKDTQLIEDKETVEKIKTIASRLLINWPCDVPKDIEIFIKLSDSFGAFTDQYNQIFITTGLLKEVSNDDQLAAVLAHELSHILLKHNQSKSVYQTLPWSFEKAGALAVIIENQMAPDEKNKTTLITQGLSATWSDISSPAWTRENERDADRLGLDLLIKAGYNQNAFFVILEKMQQVQMNQGERLKNMALLAKNSVNLLSSSSISEVPVDYIRTPLTEFMSTMINSTVDQVHKMFAEKNVDYDLPQERINVLKTYYAERYPNHKSERMKKEVKQSIDNAWWNKKPLPKIDDINEKKKLKVKKSKKQKQTVKQTIIQTPNENEASKFSYDDIIKSNYMPAIAYIEVSQQYLSKSEPRYQALAYEILQLGVKRIGRAYRFYPYLIPAAKANGDIRLAEQFAQECSRNQDRDWLQIVTDTLTKETTKNLMYPECVKALGYDPLHKKLN